MSEPAQRTDPESRPYAWRCERCSRVETGKYKPNDFMDEPGMQPGTQVSAMACPQCNDEMEFLGRITLS
jgi:hypothetical protein